MSREGFDLDFNPKLDCPNSRPKYTPNTQLFEFFLPRCKTEHVKIILPCNFAPCFRINSEWAYRLFDSTCHQISFDDRQISKQFELTEIQIESNKIDDESLRRQQSQNIRRQQQGEHVLNVDLMKHASYMLAIKINCYY